MARSLNKAKKTKKEGRNSMAENIVFQILRSHLMEGELTPGAPIAIRVDQTLGHDLTGIMAGQTFLAVGADRVQTEASVFYCDHNIPPNYFTHNRINHGIFIVDQNRQTFKCLLKN